MAGWYRDVMAQIDDRWLIERCDVEMMDHPTGDPRKGTDHGHG